MDIKYLLEIEKIINDKAKSEATKANELDDIFKKDKTYLHMLAIATDKVKLDFEKKCLQDEYGNLDEISNNIKDKISHINVSEIEFSTFRNKFSKLIIPEYQRNYSWKSNTYNLFLSSLYNLNPKDDNLNIGGMIISPDKKIRSISFGEELYIIDGQQRLTSLYGTLTFIAYLYFVEDKIKLSAKSIKSLNEFLSDDELNLKYTALSESNVISTLAIVFKFIKNYDNANILERKKLLNEFKNKKLLISGKQIFYNEIKKIKNEEGEIDGEKIDKILESISKVCFTTYITYGEKEAFKKFYETNSISVDLSIVDIMRSAFYRFGYSKIKKWVRIAEQFNVNFKANDDIQFFNFYLTGSLKSPSESFQIIEDKMINAKNIEDKNEFLTSLEYFMEIKDNFYKNILKYIKDVKLANIIWLFKKMDVNKQISNMLVVFWAKNNEFYVGKEETISKKLLEAIKAWDYYKNDEDNNIPSPRSNSIDSPLKAKTNNDNNIFKSSDVNEYLKLLDTYIDPVNGKFDKVNIFNIIKNINNNQGLSYNESKLINYLLEGVKNVGLDEFDEKINNHEHLIPRSIRETTKQEVIVYKRYLLENKLSISEHPIDQFYNLIICDSNFNEKVLTNKGLLEKIELLISNSEKIKNYHIYNEMFEKIKKEFDINIDPQIRVIKALEIIIDTKERLLKNTFTVM